MEREVEGTTQMIEREFPDNPTAEDWKARYPESWWQPGNRRTGRWKSYEDMTSDTLPVNQVFLKFIDLKRGLLAQMAWNHHADVDEGHILLGNSKLLTSADYRSEICYMIDGGANMPILRDMHKADIDLTCAVLLFFTTQITNGVQDLYNGCLSIQDLYDEWRATATWLQVYQRIQGLIVDKQEDGDPKQAGVAQHECCEAS